MNIIFAAFCVNIAVVNAEFDLKALLKLLTARRAGSPGFAETNEPVQAMSIIPGFYLIKPEAISKSQFQYSKNRLNSHDGSSDRLNTKKEKTKSFRKIIRGKEILMAKVLKALKNRGMQKNTKTRTSSTSNLISKNKNLLATILNAVNKLNIKGKQKYQQSKRTNGAIMKQIIKVLKSLKQYREKKSSPIVVINTKPRKKWSSRNTKRIEDLLNWKIYDDINDEMENDAREILDELSSEDEINRYRRHIGKDKKKNEDSEIDRGELLYNTVEEEEESSGSEENEKNPGNPFTIHKNKYKQNWLWNHYMDGDHMNINPLGPQFGSMGPSGPDLFFGRKWWYFNQDDYKPMG